MGQQNRTLAAGRYEFQAEAERLIASDVIAKLRPLPDSHFLEIGCGPGLLLSAIEPLVAESVGIDSEDQIALARDHTSGRLIVGDFSSIALDETFDRILIYSVIHCLADFTTVQRFLDKAAALLLSGGRLLVGDIPNSDTKAAYIASDVGSRMNAEWVTRVSDTPRPRGSGGIGAFNSDQIFRLMANFRQRGFLTYLLPQNPNLPFGNTREDLLIIRL